MLPEEGFWIVMKLVRWLLMLSVVLGALIVSPALAQNTAAVDKAIAYVRTQQQADGSFPGFGAGSTADAIIALAAAKVNVADVKQGGVSALNFVQSQAQGVGKDPGVAAKFLIAMTMAGQAPQLPNGADLIKEVQQGRNAQTGQYGPDVTTHAYALIGLVAAGTTPETAAIDALKKLQLPDGGWSFDGTAATGSDTNTTGLAIQALKAVGDSSDAISKAVAYLKGQQNSDGGFPYSQTSSFGNASDANSTALALQGLLAAGEDLKNYTKAGKTPVDRLLQFQNDSGAFRYQDATPDDNQLATYQAIPALLQQTLPLKAMSTASSPSALPSTGSANRTAMLIVLSMLAIGMIAGGALVVRRRA